MKFRIISKYRLLFAFCGIVGVGLAGSSCDDQTLSSQEEQNAEASLDLQLDPTPELNWETFATVRKVSGCCAIRIRFVQSNPPTFAETQFKL